MTSDEPLTSAISTLQSYMSGDGQIELSESQQVTVRLAASLRTLSSTLVRAAGRQQDIVRSLSENGEGEWRRNESMAESFAKVNSVIGGFEDQISGSFQVSPSGDALHIIEITISDLIPRFFRDTIIRESDDLIQSFDTGNYRDAHDHLGSFVKIITDASSAFVTPAFDAVLWARRSLPSEYEINVSDSLNGNLSNYIAAKLATAEEDAQLSLANIRKASGEAASERQERTFLAFSAEESSLSKWWTGGVFAFVLLGIVAPITILSLDVQVSNVASWAGVLIKLAIGLPLFGIAAYCGRVAAQHRELARHMKLLAVQVDTIESYIENMNDQQKSEMRVLLGKRLFSSVDLEVKDSGNISVIPTEVIPLLEKAMDIGKDAVNMRGA